MKPDTYELNFEVKIDGEEIQGKLVMVFDAEEDIKMAISEINDVISDIIRETEENN